MVRPPNEIGRPYLRRLSLWNGISVWIVKGQYVRDRIDEEFTNFGQPRAFPFIPPGEFWLDEENAPGEEEFFLRHLIVEYQLMAGGSDYDSALDRAGKAEREARRASVLGEEGRQLQDSGRNAELMKRVHKELWAECSGATRVWIVDGELVRDVFFIDFTEGGHDKVYDFIPGNEVWIDDDVMAEERPFILLHELHERWRMAGGLDYSRAHRESSRIELKCRRRPALLDAALRQALQRNRGSIRPAP
jgi:hypothetical protein